MGVVTNASERRMVCLRGGFWGRVPIGIMDMNRRPGTHILYPPQGGLRHDRDIAKSGDFDISQNSRRTKRRSRREEQLMVKRSFVSVVDDDESVRESLPDLLKEFGFAVKAFSSAEEFLSSRFVTKTDCLILDVAMPGMSGPELQRELSQRQHKIPIIFITAQRDEAIRPQVLKAGAVECLTKPFSDTALLAALNSAFRTK